MKSVVILAMLLTCAACVASARAQESPPPPNLLLQLSRPPQSVPVESSMRDDILARPASPRPDPLRDSFRLYVGVGDARCYPGEDGFMPERLPGRRRPR
jgi:hypothetical protein